MCMYSSTVGVWNVVYGVCEGQKVGRRSEGYGNDTVREGRKWELNMGNVDYVSF